jgi:hypothetical protein
MAPKAARKQALVWRVRVVTLLWAITASFLLRTGDVAAQTFGLDIDICGLLVDDWGTGYCSSTSPYPDNFRCQGTSLEICLDCTSVGPPNYPRIAFDCTLFNFGPFAECRMAGCDYSSGLPACSSDVKVPEGTSCGFNKVILICVMVCTRSCFLYFFLSLSLSPPLSFLSYLQHSAVHRYAMRQAIAWASVRVPVPLVKTGAHAQHQLSPTRVTARPAGRALHVPPTSTTARRTHVRMARRVLTK